MISSRPCLLIVDDEPSNIQLLASIFSENYQVLFATNGKSGLTIAMRELPDLILLDVVMPDIDGYEVCQQLKADALTAKIPVIFITACHKSNQEIRGLEVGAADYISKPFCPAIVKIRVKNQLELKAAREKLLQIAITDGLTGIANRRYFDEQLSNEWCRANRMNQQLAVAMIDVDWFKKYNDYYGHQMGDDCLRQIANVLSRSVKRSNDFVARYGGEEFAFILLATDSFAVVENARIALSELALPHALSEFGKVTLSAGIAVAIPDKNDVAESLVNGADKALYIAKNRGRNQVVLFNSSYEC